MDTNKFRVFFLTISLIMGLHMSHGHELIRNGDLAEVLYGWGIDVQLEDKLPYSVELQAIDLLEVLDDMGMMPGPTLLGTMVHQPLNVEVPAGAPLAVGMDVRATGWSFPPGHTVALYLEYLDAGGERHRIRVLNPDNGEVPDDAWERFSASISAPAGMDRLVGVALEREGEGRFAVRNVSVTAGAPNGVLPDLQSVTPAEAAYGEAITLAGEHFGTTPGVVYVGGNTNGVTIAAWSDNAVQIELNDPSIGGKVTLEAGGARTWRPRSIRVTSPYHTVEIKPTSMMHVPWDIGMVAAIEGQQVRVAVFNRFFNGFDPPALNGVALSVLEPLSAEFSLNPVYRHGGALLYIDTLGLTQGVHTVTVQADDGERLPRTASFDFFVHQVQSAELVYIDNGSYPPLGSQEITRQGSFSLLVNMTNAYQAPIYDTFFEPPVQFESSNPTILETFHDAGPWGGTHLLVHDSGVATITATLPNGSNVTATVTITIPESPRVEHSWLEQGTMNNIPLVNTNYFNIEVSDNFGSRGVTFPGIGVEGGFFGSGAQWGYRFHLRSLEEYNSQPEPGRYLWRARCSVGGETVSAARIMTVVNDPATALLRGRVAHYDEGHGHGVYGSLLLYDAATGALLDERDIWGDIDSYLAARVAPGTYKFRWVSEPNIDQWYPNAANFDEAAAILVEAGEELIELDFVVPPPSAPMPPPVLATPVVDPNAGIFSMTIPAETDGRYQLIKTSSMKDHTWYPVGWEEWEWDGEVTLEDNDADAGPAFYRVRRNR